MTPAKAWTPHVISPDLLMGLPCRARMTTSWHAVALVVWLFLLRFCCASCAVTLDDIEAGGKWRSGVEQAYVPGAEAPRYNWLACLPWFFCWP